MRWQHYNVQAPCVLNQGGWHNYNVAPLVHYVFTSELNKLKEIVKKLKKKGIDKGDLAKLKEITKKQWTKHEIDKGDKERWRKWENKVKDIKRDKYVTGLNHNLHHANQFQFLKIW
jgi:hypothetical protein